MKKKKISEKENEWKGVLVDDNQDVKMYEYNKDNTKGYFYQVGESNITPDSFTVTSTNVNNEIVGEVNVNKSFIWGTPGSDYDVDELTKQWRDFAKDKTLSGEEEHCNIRVNKDWDFTKEELNKFYHDNWVKENVSYKERRIDFEFTPLTFWQLTPSIAINLHCKEIELTWLCFGAYINFKRNG